MSSSHDVLLLAHGGLCRRLDGRQLPQRCRRPFAAGKEPDLARFALRRLSTAGALVRQPAAAELPVAARPLPDVSRDLFTAVFLRGAADGSRLRGTLLPRSCREYP